MKRLLFFVFLFIFFTGFSNPLSASIRKQECREKLRIEIPRLLVSFGNTLLQIGESEGSAPSFVLFSIALKPDQVLRSPQVFSQAKDRLKERVLCDSLVHISPEGLRFTLVLDGNLEDFKQIAEEFNATVSPVFYSASLFETLQALKIEEKAETVSPPTPVVESSQSTQDLPTIRVKNPPKVKRPKVYSQSGFYRPEPYSPEPLQPETSVDLIDSHQYRETSASVQSVILDLNTLANELLTSVEVQEIKKVIHFHNSFFEIPYFKNVSERQLKVILNTLKKISAHVNHSNGVRMPWDELWNTFRNGRKVSRVIMGKGDLGAIYGIREENHFLVLSVAVKDVADQIQFLDTLERRVEGGR